MYKYSNSINLLIARFPSMKKIYRENIEDYIGLPYIFYESEFLKYIMGKIRSKNEIELEKIFGFIEELLLHGDDEFINLVGVAIVESMYFEKDFAEFYQFILKFCGDLTQKSFENCFNNGELTPE